MSCVSLLQIHTNDRPAQDHFLHGSWLVQSLTGLGSLPWAVSAPIVEHRYFWAMMSQMAHAPVVPVSPLIKQGL